MEFCSYALSILCIRIVFISFQFTEIIFDFCMSPGAHRTRGGRQKEGGGGKASKASG